MAVESAITIRSRKLQTNPLLKRKQMIIDVIHPGRPTIPRTELRTKLAGMYKASVDTVICYGFKTIFGGGKSTGFALIYDNLEAVKTFEPKYRQARNGLVKITKQGRKSRKEKKNRSKKVRGSKKHKTAQSGKK